MPKLPNDNSPASEVVSAEWSRALAAADTARVRAQSGFTVASAIAAALVAAGLFTNLSDRAHPARWIGAAALGLWLAAMLMFLLAVATRTKPVISAGVATMEQWALARLTSVEAERHKVERRLSLAVGVTIVAVAVTAATLLVGVIGWGIDRDKGLLLLTPRGVTAVKRVCKTANAREGARSVKTTGSPLHGTLDVPTLKSDFVVFRIDKGECRLAKVTPVRIPRGDVLVFSEDSSS